MKFFQVLITNEFKHTGEDKVYKHVYNYATLAEALRTMRMYEDKDQADGYTYTEGLTGRDVLQYHLNFEEKGGAVLELRHEYFGTPEGSDIVQIMTLQAVYVKEIIL